MSTCGYAEQFDGHVHGVEEEDDPSDGQLAVSLGMSRDELSYYAPLAEIIGERDVLEKAVNDGLGLEGGGRLLDDGDHGC